PCHLTSAGAPWDPHPSPTRRSSDLAASLDGALLNAGTGTVSFAVADGGMFFVFASDVSSSVFTTGMGFSFTVTLADGSVVMVPTALKVTRLNSSHVESASAGSSLTQ